MSSGGTQRNMVNLLNNIKLNNKNKILFLYNPTQSSCFENKIDENVKIYRVPASKFKHLTRLKLLLRIIKEENITSIISYALTGTYLALISRLIFPFKRLPVIYRMVSVDSALTNSRFWISKEINKFLFFNVICRFVNTIISQSNYMKKSLVSKFRMLTKDKVIVIKNLVDFSVIDNNLDEDFKPNYNYLVYVGRLSPEKNIIQIIKAFNIIKNRTKYKLLLIGDGDQYDEIKDVIQNLHLEKKVLMIGFQSNPYKYIYNSSGLILFSSYEGFPNVVLEAMYCKIPTIISDFDGATELVIHKKNGFIVKRNNINILSDQILEMINNKNLSKKIITNAYDFVLKLNNESIKKYKQLIDK